MHLQLLGAQPHAAMIAPTLLHPKSVGEITLQSSDPFVHPKIQPNYLTAPEDVATLREGLKLADHIYNTDPFKGILAEKLYDTLHDVIGVKRSENEDLFWFVVTWIVAHSICLAGKLSLACSRQLFIIQWALAAKALTPWR